jgi:peptide deformylase
MVPSFSRESSVAKQARIESIMRLKIAQGGEPVLRQQTRPLTPEEIVAAETQQLIAWMKETMHDAPGVGLAAPEAGRRLDEGRER